MPNVKNAKIHGEMHYVVSLEEYSRNRNIYNPSSTAIEYCGKLLPIVSPSSKDAGIVVLKDAPMCLVRHPDPNDRDYDAENAIDMSDVNSIKEFMLKQNSIRQIENDVLTTPNNITRYKISSDDDSEMAALKTAVNDKHIDMDKYAYRFGSNYNNDKRLFNKHNISLPMLKRVCNALDIKATLVLEDAYDGVPNPIGAGNVLSAVITGEGGSIDEENDY